MWEAVLKNILKNQFSMKSTVEPEYINTMLRKGLMDVEHESATVTWSISLEINEESLIISDAEIDSVIIKDVSYLEEGGEYMSKYTEVGDVELDVSQVDVDMEFEDGTVSVGFMQVDFSYDAKLVGKLEEIGF